MTEQRNPVLISDPETGKTEKRRLLADDEIAFSVRMALRGNALSGVLHKNRDSIKASVERSIIDHFRLCNYRIYGIVPENGPIVCGKSKDDGCP